MRDGKGIEQRCLGNGKDRCIGSNAQPKRPNGNRRDTRTLREHAQAVAHILQDCCNPKVCTRLSLALFEERRIAELAPCCPGRVLPAHALANMPLRQKLNVRFYFVAKLAIRVSLSEQPTESRYESEDQRGHGYSPLSRRRTRPITPEIVSQC